MGRQALEEDDRLVEMVNCAMGVGALAKQRDSGSSLFMPSTES